MKRLLLTAVIAIFFAITGCSSYYSEIAPPILEGNPIAVNTGNKNNMLITCDGNLWGWGWDVPIPGTQVQFFHNLTFVLDDVVAVATPGTPGQSTLALRSDGTLVAWGNNRVGLLGLGDVEYSTNPTVVMDNIRYLTSHNLHTMAITEDSTLWVWGLNAHGVFGDLPTSIRKPTKKLENIALVTSSINNALVVTTTGELYAWGSNQNKHYIKSDVVAIATGTSHSLAITSDGSLWAWGCNNFGQLGTGNTISSNAPIFVMQDVVNVFAEDNYTMVITLDGKLIGFGENQHGQLGTNTSDSVIEPRNILNNIADVSLCGGSVAAITTYGTVYTWGHIFTGHFFIFRSPDPGLLYHDIHTPTIVFSSEGFVQNSSYFYGRWTLAESSEFCPRTIATNENRFTAFFFYEDGTGRIADAFRSEGRVMVMAEWEYFNWSFSSDGTLSIELANGDILTGTTSIHIRRFLSGNHPSVGDVLTIRGENFYKILDRAVPYRPLG